MVKKEDFKNFLYLVKRFILPYWPHSLLLILLSFLAAIITTIQPLMIAPAMDVALHTNTSPAGSLSGLTLNNIGATILGALGLSKSNGIMLIAAIAAIYALLSIVAGILTFAAYLLSAWIGSKAYHNLQIALHSHLLDLSMRYFIKQKTGEVVSRFVGDAGEAMTSLDLSLRQMVQAGCQIIFCSILLFRTSPSLTVATLSVSLLHWVVTRLLRDRIRNRTSDRFDALAEVSSVIQELFLSIRVIKSFAAEWFERVHFSEKAAHLQKLTMKLGIYRHIEEPLRAITDALAIGVVLLLAFLNLQKGHLTVSGFIMFMFLTRQTIIPISIFAQSVIRLQGGLGSAKRVLEILKTKPDLVDGEKEANRLVNNITLKNVSFAYRKNLYVLRDIYLEIHKGEAVAVVGPSGGGKSTLADLILRLYDPDMGQIMLDGIDIRTFKQTSYRNIFGVVSQECLLFNASIRDNITYGHHNCNEEDVVHAARIANAEEFINRLPEGYDTIVGDRGIRLSGGQRQRLAIARAIYAKPDILILDEATSSLDSESELLVQTAIERILKNMTAIVIAHRLSTIINADKIIVLNNGCIETVGTHLSLLSLSNTYRRLYDLQFNTTLKMQQKGE